MPAPPPETAAQTTAPTTLALATPLRAALGERQAGVFTRAFGHRTVGDLLAHYPRRYAQRGELTALAELPPGDDVTIVAEVLRCDKRAMRQRHGSIVEAAISDGTGVLTLTFFNQAWRANELIPGRRGIFAGKVNRYKGTLQLTHPDYELFDEASAPDVESWQSKPIPIYPATSTLASWKIAKVVREEVLPKLGHVDDPVPEAVAREHGLEPLDAALRGIHTPATDTDWRRARDTLRYQEAFVLQSALLLERERLRETAATARMPVADGYAARFDAHLPFDLTADQRAVGEQVEHDLAQAVPMNRLVQGEVGSGKTVVALRAMLQVADNGGQSAFLAPTEVLASQHLRSIAAALGPDLAAELMPTLITGRLTAAERKKALLRAVSGQAQIVVGTHALLNENVSFFDLGLVVVDEQHRFGVEQRDVLRSKAATPPHQLVLTATPIPRTVAMTVFGDLDVSTIAQLPTGRQKIESFVVPLAEHPRWQNRIWERAAEEIAAGHQVFVVCPAITPKEPEEGETENPIDEAADDSRPLTPVATVEQTIEAVRDNPVLQGVRVAALHGRMSADDKDAVMRAFAAGALDLIVATTVIEVGVDVPNASAMIVLDADRFGVSQLHQLRGRVGRGSVPGLCLFVTNAENGSLARERVDAVAATLDGFALAEADLELRREGDVLGSDQSGGRSSLRLLRVARDGAIIERARADAAAVLESDPHLADHPALSAAIADRLTDRTRDFLARA
ncbi:ATP-dependent DNA helicase RecG [Humibacter ginsenosidimutans]|uniref:Probable DNA 3'-5' helicase RecG n=1 Tax=Humibacter ginsenosidimutans TaxID=2599293 RepID=A0A5B8M1A9_9MICO|nr:ATP-dependent DNA helicase RecG [Humibacter ginsenosidimutans]QDZ14113.1 ATP-dependent DNA helicase RecG [Humibacter ginsenosidimutans]